MNTVKVLIRKAEEAAKLAYAPYSKYHVGAALLTENGKIFTGCNIENVSFGATNCAERTAFFKAVSQGYKDFSAIAIVGRPAEVIAGNNYPDYAYPCGICRQVMHEFCDDEFKVIVAKSTEDYKEYSLKQLLPCGFGGL